MKAEAGLWATGEGGRLLAAARATPGDDAVRLVYADWLEENGEQDRAAHLRLQARLAREWWYDSPCLGLYSEIAALAARLDAAWLAAVRRCTTPAPPVDIEKALPALRGKAKTAVRLHPRPGEAPTDASKIGGMFLWPREEPWPACSRHGNVPYVPALQLRKEDVPEVGFLPGTDLFQLLWCPVRHDEEDMYCPKPAAYWRKRSAVARARKAPPGRPTVEYGYFPRPCLVYPERVTEYPGPFEYSPVGYPYPEEDYHPELHAALAVLRCAKAPALPR